MAKIIIEIACFAALGFGVFLQFAGFSMVLNLKNYKQKNINLRGTKRIAGGILLFLIGVGVAYLQFVVRQALFDMDRT